MTRTVIKILIGTAVFLPSFCLADSTLLSQTDSSASVTLTAGQNFFQQLGTGLVGTFKEVSFYYGADAAAGDGSYVISMSHCDNSGYTVNCVSDFSGIASTTDQIILAAGRANTQSFYSTTTPFDLDPTKYYKIGVAYSSRTQHALVVLGTTGSGYANGDCVDGSGTSLSTLTDCFFVINGVSSTGGTSYGSVSSLTPQTGSTTAATYVNFRFNYTAGTATNYLMSVKDLTSGYDFSLTGALSGGTISRYATLTSGHGYSWNVFLTDSDYDSVPYTPSTAQYFSVVSSFASTSVMDIWFNATGTTLYDTSGNLIFASDATTTAGNVPAGCASWAALGSVGTALKTRFPFSYICDFGYVINELNQTAGTTTLTITKPALWGQASDTVVILDESQLSPGSPVRRVRTVIEYAMWLVAAFSWIKLAFKVM